MIYSFRSEVRICIPTAGDSDYRGEKLVKKIGLGVKKILAIIMTYESTKPTVHK